MNLQEALGQVEKKLMAFATESGAAVKDDGTKVFIGLWDQDSVSGVRVFEVTFSRETPNSKLSTGWLQSDLDGLLACAAVERCILARVMSLDASDVENADASLSRIFEKGADQAEVDERQGTYLRLGGTHCPFCESQEISGGEVNIDAGTATQEVGCDNCNQEWKDLYRLEGFLAA